MKVKFIIVLILMAICYSRDYYIDYIIRIHTVDFGFYELFLNKIFTTKITKTEYDSHIPFERLTNCKIAHFNCKVLLITYKYYKEDKK